MSKTIEERFLLCAELYEEAKEIARSAMPDGLSTAEQEEFVFRRIHGKDPSEIIDSH